jgi:catecholate siderophore receptor
VLPRHSRSPNNRPIPLGALAAGFGLLTLGGSALAQATAPAAPPKPQDTTLPAISVKAAAETDANSVRATTSGIGKGQQDLRDIPQSVTVLTEKLLEDRRVDTLKEALHQTAGVTFVAGEGGEEDVRLRGFSLATSGDIYVDGLRDPAFYDRDTFSYERVEVLRGSASMLFGRGSTGGVVNQVHKQARAADSNEVAFTAGSGEFLRFTGDFNIRTGANAGLRINVMKTDAANFGNRVDKRGIALNTRFGIGTADEVSLSAYNLVNNNGIHYGLPWLRKSSAQAGTDPSGLIEGLDPRNYYAAASDYNRGSATYGTVAWTHRFAAGGDLKTTLRQGSYDRDQHASAVRFCVAPTCPGFTTPGLDGPVRLTAATPLTLGTNNKVQDLTTTYLQSDYSRRIKAWGMTHEVLAGVDLAHERFNGYATVLPDGVVLDKNAVRTTIGSPNSGVAWVDESLRIKRRQAAFEAKAAGLYAQDLLQLTDTVKLLGGLRYDRFQGDYRTYATAATAATSSVGAETAQRGRSDGLWSHRIGALYQPDDALSFHASYATSFNTSGDTYQYDLPGSNTPPEGSRNFELGAKMDLLAGRLSTRLALFHSVKTNERNRDSPAGTPLTDYLLSGRRHASGLEVDIAGRIADGWEVFGSYAWIPVAKIDAGNADGSTLTGEQVGQRPSLTPRHSGTLWTTWQATPAWRFGGGLNARSSQTPNRNPAGIVAPAYVTGDLLAEVTLSEAVAVKLNVNNVTNKLFADALYTAHYIPGAGRSVQATLVARF